VTGYILCYLVFIVKLQKCIKHFCKKKIQSDSLGGNYSNT
jgi:hypothetical protein